MEKKALSWISVLIIFGVLIYFLNKIGLKEIFDLIKKANLFFLSLSFLFMFCMFFLWNYSWVLALETKLKRKISSFSTLPLYFIGTFFNDLTPGAKVGGEPFRAYYASRKFKIKKSTCLATVMFQKGLTYAVHFAFVLISLFLLVYFFSFSEMENIILFTLSLFSFLVLIIVAAYFSRKKIENLIDYFSFTHTFFGNRFKNKKEFSSYFKRRYRNFCFHIKSLVKNRKLLVYVLLLSLLSKVFFYLSSYLIFLSLNIEFPFLFIIIGMSLMLFFEDLSGLPGGFGFSEGALILIYNLLGLRAIEAASVTLLSRGVYYFHTLVLGAMSFLYLKFKYK